MRSGRSGDGEAAASASGGRRICSLQQLRYRLISGQFPPEEEGRLRARLNQLQQSARQ